MRSWEIIEQGRDEYGRDMGFRGMDPEEEAYKEGCRHGYEKAMREMQGSMGERMGYHEDYGERGGYGNRGGGSYGERRRPGYLSEGPYMGYRGDDEMGERRRRRSNGQFY